MAGEGVAKDCHGAEEWFLFAASRGHKDAGNNLEVINKQRNIKLAFVLVATIAFGFIVTSALTGYGGDFFKAMLEEPEVQMTSAAPPTNPGFFSSK